jgi:hypothetical protein
VPSLPGKTGWHWLARLEDAMNTGELLTEIRAAFPVVAMPPQQDLRFHPDGCAQCRYLSEYLHERRGLPVDGPVIRYMHPEMSCLSAKGWAWALPHYLPYCLTSEAEYNGMETEFLIYNLGCSDEYKDNMRSQLSSLTARQLCCLHHFVEYLSVHPTWSEYCPDEIARALLFMRELENRP